MTTPTYQPGDVAMVRAVTTIAAFGGRRAVRRGGVWMFLDHEGYVIDAYVEDVRPLVVIDPEDSEQVERLAGCLDSRIIDDADMLQAALREFAAPKPPKPKEPQGLGAVIEDARGELWVRDKTTTTVHHWKRARGEDGSRRYPYSHIDAVRILSPGYDGGETR